MADANGDALTAAATAAASASSATASSAAAASSSSSGSVGSRPLPALALVPRPAVLSNLLADPPARPGLHLLHSWEALVAAGGVTAMVDADGGRAVCARGAACA